MLALADWAGRGQGAGGYDVLADLVAPRVCAWLSAALAVPTGAGRQR